MAPNEPRSGRGWVLKCPGPSGLLLALLAALLLARCAAAARPAPDRPGVSGGGAKRAACIGGGQQVAGVLADARALRADIFKFWLDHGPDTTYGGVHATLDRGGVVAAPTDKGIVQQARHVWSLSHAVRSKAMTGQAARRAKALARSSWHFMRDHIHRAAEPGTWSWLVSRDGATAVEDTVNLYGQFFAIYALTEYSRAFNDKEALAYALSTFQATDRLFHDPVYGGFNETNSLPTLHGVRLPGGGMPRTLNIFLHGTESLAALYEASGDKDVLARLLELLELLTTKLVTDDDVIYEYYDPAGATQPAAPAQLLTSLVRSTGVLPAAPPAPRGAGKWAPVGPPTVNWGHNLESAWLVAVTTDMLKAKKALPKATANAYAATLLMVASNAASQGYDSQHGGVYELGVPGAAPGVGEGASTDKIWWIQAESMLALAQLYKRQKECAHLDKLQGVMQFVKDHIRDPVDGEWLWSTNAAGDAPVKDGYDYQKGNKWKASYHNARVLMFLEEWLN